VIISASAAKAFFGDEEPLNQTLRLENQLEVMVTGVYEDMPHNSNFSEFQLFFPWPLILTYRPWIQEVENNWTRQFVNVYVQLQPNTSLETANAAIHDLYAKNVPQDYYAVIEKNQPFAQLIPMSSWHLYSEIINGKPAAGRIIYVWLFGIVGGLVLLVACINFVNLSTARSEKRAREVGVRKTMGSYKGQLVTQFLSESLLTVLLAFIGANIFLVLALNPFNALADKAIALPFDKPEFWGISFAFIFLTVMLAGLYPAFYLSSFQPVKVLKGVLHTGRLAALPRKVLVVVQFTVSVVLILGTLIIHKQLQYARERPVGYDVEGLISLRMSDNANKGKVDLIRTELLNTGVVTEVATSSSHLTGINAFGSGFEWQGKDPHQNLEFVFSNVSPDFGKTVRWEVVTGRDFSRDIAMDTTHAIIINETAVKQMVLENPIGNELTSLNEFGRPLWSKTIIGVVKDIIVESPYDAVKPTIYYFNEKASNIFHIKLNPEVSVHTALSKIEATLEKIIPSVLFDYMFVDEEFGQKFSQEVRLGKISGIFAVLAVFISCLGLFGLASFVAEQRTKEIGIRKVMGASISSVWQMLSLDFVVLVLYSCLMAVPVGYYLIDRWLQRYEYHTEFPWWLILATCLGAILLTVLTVSYQSIKAALMNPVESLRSE
jgi:ABC-type antimicrobial peptide transport system permease subunit